MRFNRQQFRFFILLSVLAILVGIAGGQVVRTHPRITGPAGTVSLPYRTADSQGNQWMVYQTGMFNMQGQFPVFNQAAQLNINGMQPNAPTNTGRLDDKTGELILENMQANGFIITRRILFNPDEQWVRYIDIIKNPQPQPQQLNIQLNSNVNFGVASSIIVQDPRKKDQTLAWVGQLNGPGKTAVELYAGKGAAAAPTITAPNGNNFIQASYAATIPANSEIALMHIHMITTTQDQGVQWVNDLKEQKFLTNVSPDIRKIIVNFSSNGSLIGDLEILRGDVLDVVELHGGDRFNGTLAEPSYSLATSYGNIQIPVEKVVSILNTGQFRPRQLVVTADGQIFGGHLAKPAIALELSSGQKTEIPLSQISRIGYRHRSTDNDDASADNTLQPSYILLSSGDRIGIAPLVDPISVITRYGPMQIPPADIASIVFSSDDNAVHTINLTDGSRFTGLVTATDFSVQLSVTGQTQKVQMPVSSIAQLVLKTAPDSQDNSTAILKLKKDDQFVGVLQGQLKLDTAFDTLTLNAPELREISQGKTPPDITVKTWDGTLFSGQLEQSSVTCHLTSGLDVTVPIELLQTYSNPSAAAPDLMLKQIKAIVANLNADDWKQRDTAEQQLIALGPAVAATLKSLRDQQPPEAQQRIDSILKQLDKQPAKPSDG